MLFFGKEKKAFKANLHTHTTLSDCKFTAQQLVMMYSQRGYQVLNFSDHGLTNDIAALDNMGMTLFSGMEIHPQHPRFGRWHLLAVNVPQDFVGGMDTFASAQEAVDAVNAAGGIVYCAHPYWYGARSTEILEVRGLAGIEVYNTATRYIGNEYNMVIWDELLDEGWNCPAIAVDDIHNLQHIFGGWTMILADDAKPETLLDALRKGSYYATQGPEFSCIEVKDGILHAEFSEVVYAVAVGRFGSGKYVVMPDTPFHGDRLTCTSMNIPLDQIKKREFVRIQIRDANGNYAWSNPIPGNAQ